MNRRLPVLLLALLAASAWACADDSSSGPPTGAAGEAATERGLFTDWALLSVPTGGGPAALHPLSDPGRELWSGTVSLPPVETAVRVAPRLVALRGADGTVHRYDPAEGAVSELGVLDGEARWHGGEVGGVWVRGGGEGDGLVWSLSTGGGVRRTVGRELHWAAPAADGATVALLGSDPATLVRWPRGAGEPDASLELPAGPPAEMTAWGRLAIVTRSDETGVVQVVSVPEMEARERIEVDGPVTAVAASPSSHEIYVGVDDPPRLMVADRFGGVSTRARFQRPIREIRPGVGGGAPVVWDGQTAHLVPWGGGDPVRLETSWRADLPLALPDGSVLVLRGDAVQRTLADGGTPSTSGASDRIWIPIRWRAEVEVSSAAADTAGPAAIPAAGADTAAAVASAGDTAAGEGATSPDSAAADSALMTQSLRVSDPGFYVVLGWSRSPAGILERLRGIRTAGFPVAVQTRRDDAGAEWYRGLVGPYSRRERARQVAETLQREQAVEGWVQEVRPELISDEVFR